jgi:disulfide bond formation protein DsbB
VGDAASGAEAFAGTCASCHGPDAKGLPSLGKDLTTSEFAMGLSDAELVAFIKTGRPIGDPLNTTGVDMPPKGGNPALTDQDLADIVAYLRTLQQ